MADVALPSSLFAGPGTGRRRPGASRRHAAGDRAEAAGGPSLDALARCKGLRFGKAMGNAAIGSHRRSRFHGQAHRELKARECCVIDAEDEAKWQQLRATPARPAV